MTIVRGDQWDGGFPGEPNQFAVDYLLLFEPVILQLEEEIPLTKDFAQPVGVRPRLS